MKPHSIATRSMILSLCFSHWAFAGAGVGTAVKVDRLDMNSKQADSFHIRFSGKKASELALRLPLETDLNLYPKGERVLTVYSPGSTLIIECSTDDSPHPVRGSYDCSFGANPWSGYQSTGNGDVVIAGDLEPELNGPANSAQIAKAIRAGKISATPASPLAVTSIDGRGERDGNSLPGDYVRVTGGEAYKILQILPQLKKTSAETTYGFEFSHGSQSVSFECKAPAQGEGSKAWTDKVECSVALH